MISQVLPPKDPSETVPIFWALEEFVTIVSVVSTATTYVGTDPNPQAILYERITINGNIASQYIHDGIDGNTYKIQSVLTMEDGSVIAVNAFIQVRSI